VKKLEDKMNIIHEKDHDTQFEKFISKTLDSLQTVIKLLEEVCHELDLAKADVLRDSGYTNAVGLPGSTLQTAEKYEAIITDVKAGVSTSQRKYISWTYQPEGSPSKTQFTMLNCGDKNKYVKQNFSKFGIQFDEASFNVTDAMKEKIVGSHVIIEVTPKSDNKEDVILKSVINFPGNTNQPVLSGGTI
jgi:hypothetical protein